MRVLGVALCIVLSAAGPLFAQDTSRFELSGAYAVVHDSDRSETFPFGWVASAGGNVNNWFGVVAEVGGSYRTCDNCQRGPFASENFRGTDRHLKVHTFLGGPRVASHAFAPLTPFGQVLFGGAHISGGVEWDGALNTGFTYQPGGGVDIKVAPNLGVRLEGDYRVIRTSGHDNKQSRFLAGVVFLFGTL